MNHKRIYRVYREVGLQAIRSDTDSGAESAD